MPARLKRSSTARRSRRKATRRARNAKPPQRLKLLQQMSLHRRAKDNKLVVRVTARDKVGKQVARCRTLDRNTDEAEAMKLGLKMHADLASSLQAQQVQPDWLPMRHALEEAQAAAKAAVEQAHAARGNTVPDNLMLDLMGWVCLMVSMDGRSKMARRLSAAVRSLEDVTLFHDRCKGGHWLQFKRLRSWAPSACEMGVQRAGIEAAIAVLSERLGLSMWVWEDMR